MIFTLTKTTCSQRGELFAKSDFHESIRLNAKVLSAKQRILQSLTFRTLGTPCDVY